MIDIPGYQNVEKTYESAASVIFRARRKRDDLPVILKMPRADYPEPQAMVRYQREYEITAGLDQDGVIKAYGLEKHRNTLLIILEDFGAESLRDLIRSGTFGAKKALDTGTFLGMAIRMAGIIGAVHAENVIHKDINLSNMVMNPETGQIKLIDFGISTILPREKPAIRNPEVLEGTLTHISSEQTGRMNRSLDYRTDLYSLGVSFYQMLTGRLPFESDDPIAICAEFWNLKTSI